MTEDKIQIASSLWLSNDSGAGIDLCPVQIKYKSEDDLLKNFKRVLKQAHDDIYQLTRYKWDAKGLIAKFHFIGEEIYESDWTYRELKRIKKNEFEDEMILQKIAVSNYTDNYELISDMTNEIIK